MADTQCFRYSISEVAWSNYSDKHTRLIGEILSVRSGFGTIVESKMV